MASTDPVRLRHEAAVAGVVLVGLPGAGKSAVGSELALRLGREFIDTDDLVERMTGRSAAQHNIVGGEAAFRAVERDAVEEACRHAGAVIATGGGSVIDPRNRELLWRHGTVAWLDVPVATLVARLSTHSVPRPMLQPYRAEKMEELYAARREFYQAADVWLDGSLPAEQLAASLVKVLTGAVRVARFPGAMTTVVGATPARRIGPT